MQMLEGVVRNYDWGSSTAIPELLGVPGDGRPWAELWLGAHPSAPSLAGCDGVPLDELIAVDPSGSLGVRSAETFGELPFLLKVIAADSPLSIQAHPSVQQAIAGYDREDAAGISVDAANRSFRDRNHKPELICALTPFEALCGFRAADRTLGFLETIEVAALDPVREMLLECDGGFQRLLEWILTLEGDSARVLVDEVVDACRVNQAGEWSSERRVVASLGDRYPGDAGVLTALLLNHVVLRPGEAIFFGAGNLHAYLRGTGVEIMANSDNVLRGGLTPKHVDVAGLLDVVDATAFEPVVQVTEPGLSITRFDSPVSEFALTRQTFDGEITIDAGPAIILCVDGCLDLGTHTLDRGDAMWIRADDGIVSAAGTATLFRAGIGPST